MSRNKFICLDCKVDTGKIFEHYFNAVGSKIGMLCIVCLEERIKRKLNSSDFPKVWINDPKLCSMSDRLRDRITRFD